MSINYLGSTKMHARDSIGARIVPVRIMRPRALEGLEELKPKFALRAKGTRSLNFLKLPRDSLPKR